MKQSFSTRLDDSFRIRGSFVRPPVVVAQRSSITVHVVVLAFIVSGLIGYLVG